MGVWNAWGAWNGDGGGEGRVCGGGMASVGATRLSKQDSTLMEDLILPRDWTPSRPRDWVQDDLGWVIRDHLSRVFASNHKQPSILSFTSFALHPGFPGVLVALARFGRVASVDGYMCLITKYDG